MGARALAATLVVVVAWPNAASARAQRREGTRATSVFSIVLPVCAKFGEVVVPPRHYRLSLGPDGFALADPTTMLLVATVPVEETQAAEVVKEPTVKVERRESTVEIIMRYGDRMVRAAGVTSEEIAVPKGSRVVLAGKQETTLEAGGPEEPSDAQLVETAVKRWMSSIKHCADKAHRNRWETDDPRFFKCVCPIVRKWRLPRLKASLLMHHPLSRGRNGFSFTVKPNGRVTWCRVWAGAKPPPEESEEATETPSDTPGEPEAAPPTADDKATTAPDKPDKTPTAPDTPDRATEPEEPPPSSEGAQ